MPLIALPILIITMLVLLGRPERSGAVHFDSRTSTDVRNEVTAALEQRYAYL